MPQQPNRRADTPPAVFHTLAVLADMQALLARLDALGHSDSALYLSMAIDRLPLPDGSAE